MPAISWILLSLYVYRVFGVFTETFLSFWLIIREASSNQVDGLSRYENTEERSTPSNRFHPKAHITTTQALGLARVVVSPRFPALGRGAVDRRPLLEVEVLLRERNRDAVSAEISIDL